MPKSKDHLDPRVIRTRKMLRDALIGLIHERDFAALTVKDITDRATLNKTTFYLHYKDINDLLVQSTVDLQAELDEALGQPRVIEANLINGVRDILILVFEHFARYSEFYDAVLNKIGTPPVIAALQNPIETAAQRAVTRLHNSDSLIDTDLIVRFMSSACIGLIQQWLVTNAERTPEHMAEQCVNLLVYGVYHTLRHSETEKETTP